LTFRAQGMRAWLFQRLSAVYLGIYLLLIIAAWFCFDRLSFSEWRALIATPYINISLAILFIALLLHAWVGVRDVLVDYASHAGVRFVILVAVAFSLLAMGIWVLNILVSVVQP